MEKIFGTLSGNKRTNRPTKQAENKKVRQFRQFPTIVFYIEKHGNRFADMESERGTDGGLRTPGRILTYLVDFYLA